MSESDTYRFQVNLSGMINILSNHLYSNPKVFLREVLQNAVDAVTARSQQDSTYQGSIHLELTGSGTGSTLMIEDDGIGLTREDVHEFLAMIGQSSKRSGADAFTQETSFIGRFGIGLLSCFMVSDEIVMVTQSAKGGKALEWRGNPDGTYHIRELETELSPGTKVYLRCKPDCEMYYESELLQQWIYDYGALLPYPITFRDEQTQRIVNDQRPLWLDDPERARGHREEVLQLGQRLLGEKFQDYIPLKTASGRTGGIAFILPHSVNLNVKKSNRVYLKYMLVSEKAENILPDWAFFVKSIIWTDELQPTASREHFYENEKLEQVRQELGDSIRAELLRMAEYDPDRLQRIIQLHALSMKALAVEDTSFFQIIYRWLPFETTYGRRKVHELMADGQKMYYTTSLDEYRQITHVASAQSLLVVNGGYVYDAELIALLPEVCAEAQTERLIPEDVSLAFTDITADERKQYYEAVRYADVALQRFRCQIQLKRFKPEDLPALFTLSQEASDLRSIETSKSVSPLALTSVLQSLSSSLQESAYSTLYLNINNSVVERIFQAKNESMIVVAIEMLYVNALMMGHYPMNRQEMQVLNQGIVRFLDWGLSANNDQGGHTE